MIIIKGEDRYLSTAIIVEEACGSVSVLDDLGRIVSLPSTRSSAETHHG